MGQDARGNDTISSNLSNGMSSLESFPFSITEVSSPEGLLTMVFEARRLLAAEGFGKNVFTGVRYESARLALSEKL